MHTGKKVPVVSVELTTGTFCEKVPVVLRGEGREGGGGPNTFIWNATAATHMEEQHSWPNIKETQLVQQTLKCSWCYKHKNASFMTVGIGWYLLASLALSLSKPTPGK